MQLSPLSYINARLFYFIFFFSLILGLSLGSSCWAMDDSDSDGKVEGVTKKLKKIKISRAGSPTPVKSKKNDSDSDSDNGKKRKNTKKKKPKKNDSNSDSSDSDTASSAAKAKTSNKSKKDASDSDSDSDDKTQHVTLARYQGNSRLVEYAQCLRTNVKGQKLPLNRARTRECIEHVKKVTKKDKKTHLVAQTFCVTATGVRSHRIKISLVLPDYKKNEADKIMEWVSKDSGERIDDTYHIRRPQKDETGKNYWGGHAEPQLISDLEAAFKRSDAIVKLFTPHSDEEDVYMCGLEIFGPYDMCDSYNGEGDNKYNCVGKLSKFRDDHQSGQQSVSQAIRNKFEDRFKGNDKDAFVVVYHAQSPYKNVHSYRAKDEGSSYSLKFISEGCRFLRQKKDFNSSYRLSQRAEITIKPDTLYGYIHQLGDITASYKPKTHCFSFP